MARRVRWALALAVAIPALGAALTSTTEAAVPAVTTSTRTIATGAGPRPVHLVRIVPGRGVRLEAVWLGGGPGRTGTVGGYIRANAGRGAVAGLNGDFFLLARNVPSGNLLIHKGRSFLGLRAGDTLEYTASQDGWVSGSHFAQAPDAGVVGHLESAGGSTLEGQLGVEAVLREQAVICCDDAALPTSSFGVRVALRGELALSDVWALVAQAGLRTAAHLLEINVLPTLAVGVRVRL